MSIGLEGEFQIQHLILAFMILGLVTYVFSYNIIKSLKFMKLWDKCIATISKLPNSGSSYEDADETEDESDESLLLDTYIDYRHKGMDYIHVKSGFYNSTYKVGDKIIIYVNPENPKEFIQKLGVIDFLPVLILLSLFIPLLFIFKKMVL